MIPENQLKTDVKIALGGLVVSGIFYLVLVLTQNPAYDCAHYLKDVLSPYQHNLLINNSVSYQRPAYSQSEKWCEANLENWYEQAQKVRKMKGFK